MPEVKPEKIAAVVVTYNRKLSLAGCLNSLLRQTYSLDAIYIIDNCCTDGTGQYLLEKQLLHQLPPPQPTPQPVETISTIPSLSCAGRTVAIHYVRMPENTGGAGGFAEGMQRVYRAGYDWIWLMDDDLLVADDALEALVEKKNTLKSRGNCQFFLNCTVFAREKPDNESLAFPLQRLSRKRYPKVGLYYWQLSQVRPRSPDSLYPWACLFNGTFIPRQLVQQVGVPDRRFYLKGDEKDYFFRAVKNFQPYTVLASRAFHPRYQPRQFDWKQYYTIRNMFVVNRRLNLTLLRNAKLIIKSLSAGLIHGRPGLILVLRAIKDGLTQNLGKRDDIGQWRRT
jgi:GT2 family glycosyltransferase